jgi:hypothetical protein
MKNLLIRFSVLCLAIATVSCSKDSSSSNTFTPKVAAIDVSKIVPTGMQTANPEAYGMISQMSGYMAMPAAFMQNPQGKTGTTSGTWTEGEYTIVYSYGDDGTQYSFSYVGTNGQGQEVFTISGWELMNGTAGSWDYSINTSAIGNDPSLGNFNVGFDWNTNDQGGYHFDMTFNMDNLSYHYVMNTFANYAGNLSMYEGTTLTDSLVWTATTGTWTDFSTDPATVTTWTNN